MVLVVKIFQCRCVPVVVADFSIRILKCLLRLTFWSYKLLS